MGGWVDAFPEVRPRKDEFQQDQRSEEERAEASSVLFDAEADLSDLTEETYAALREEVPFADVKMDLPAALLDVLTACGAFESRGEAKRAIRQGGVSLNGTRVSEPRSR